MGAALDRLRAQYSAPKQDQPKASALSRLRERYGSGPQSAVVDDDRITTEEFLAGAGRAMSSGADAVVRNPVASLASGGSQVLRGGLELGRQAYEAYRQPQDIADEAIDQALNVEYDPGVRSKHRDRRRAPGWRVREQPTEPRENAVRNAFEDARSRLTEGAEAIESTFSPEARRQRSEIGNAEGVIGTLGALARNPLGAATMLGETIPQIGAGGLFARGGGLLGAQAGEAVLAAGMSGDQVRAAFDNPALRESVARSDEFRELSKLLGSEQKAMQALVNDRARDAAMTVGGATLLIGRIASKIGGDTINQQLAGEVAENAATLPGRVAQYSGKVAGETATEGAQGAVEQGAQNIATDRPWDERIAESATLEAALGGGVGAATSLGTLRAPLVRTPPTGDPDIDEANRIVDDALNGGENNAVIPVRAKASPGNGLGSDRGVPVDYGDRSPSADIRGQPRAPIAPSTEPADQLDEIDRLLAPYEDELEGPRVDSADAAAATELGAARAEFDEPGLRDRPFTGQERGDLLGDDRAPIAADANPNALQPLAPDREARRPVDDGPSGGLDRLIEDDSVRLSRERQAPSGWDDSFGEPTSAPQVDEVDLDEGEFERFFGRSAAESATPEQWQEAGRLYQGLAQQDGYARYPISKRQSPAEVAEDISPGLAVSELYEPNDYAKQSGVTAMADVEMPDGSRAQMHIYDGNKLAIDAIGLKSGESSGSLLYHLAANYAYNNGLKFIGDPRGIEAAAIERRSEHMLNSALRFGTTRHLEPHPHQINPEAKGSKGRGKGIAPLKWEPGNDAANIASLLQTTYANVVRNHPEIRNARYNFDKGQFETRDGTPLPGGIIPTASSGRGGPARAGRTTLARAVLGQSILSRVVQGARPRDGNGVLAADARQRGPVELGSVKGTQAEGIGYSRGKEDGVPTTGVAQRGVIPERGPASRDGVRGGVRDKARAAAVSAFGDRTIRRLETNGILKFVSRDEARRLLGHDPAGVQGFVKGNTAYALDDLSSDVAPGVVLHEVGVHYGLERMIGAEEFARIKGQMRKLRESDPDVKASYESAQASLDAAVQDLKDARESGDADAIKQAINQVESERKYFDEEAIAYLAESNPDHSIIRRILDAVTGFLRRIGIPSTWLESRKGEILRMVRDSLRAAGNRSSVATELRAYPAAAADPAEVRASNAHGLISKAEMIKRGADGHLSFAKERFIPIDKIDGLEPTPAASDDEGYRKGRPITQPIEVMYDRDTDSYMLYGGNHRVTQARINGQSHILAFVQPDRGIVGPSAKISDPDSNTRYSNATVRASKAPTEQTQTEAFKRWFGRSKITQGGRPLVLYHGTSADIETFDITKSASSAPQADKAFWFSNDPGVAAQYGAAVYPVFVRMENPLVVKIKAVAFKSTNGWLVRITDDAVGPRIARGGPYSTKAEALEAAASLDLNPTGRMMAMAADIAKRDGHDGVIFRGIDDSVGSESIVSDVYGVFSPEQIKSAIGNVGTFDPKNPDIRYSRKTPQQAQGEAVAKRQTLRATLPAGPAAPFTGRVLATSKTKAGWRQFRIAAQDKMLRLLEVQEDIKAAGGVVNELADAYRAENLMHGRVGERIEQVDRKLVKPFIEYMRKAKISAADVERAAYLLHAEERNQQIAKINPNMPDGGSGIDTADAQAELQSLQQTKDWPKIKRAVTMLHQITAYTRQALLDGGIITQDEFNALSSQYANYVPLRGTDGDELGYSGAGTGKGLDSRPKPFRRALGRGAGNEAVNILGEVINDARRAIILSEKARVGRAAMRLALENKNPDLWEVEPVEVEQKYSDAAGAVYLAVKNLANDPNVLVVKHRGKPYQLKVYDPELAAALKSLDQEQLPKVLQWMSSYNRYLSAVFTRYNPGFVAVNMARDGIFGLTRLGSEHGAAVMGRAMKYYGPAMRALWRNARGKQQGGNVKMAMYEREFAEAGGRTYFTGLKNVQDLQLQAQDEVKTLGELMMTGRKWAAVKRAVGDNPITRAIEATNDSIENAMRLAAYASLRESGKTPEQASIIAKDLTVNFNRRGSKTSVFNALWLFFNASVQGSHAVIKAMKHPKFWGVVGGLSALQAASALFLMGVEDDDGVSAWEAIPEHDRQRNLIFAWPTIDKNGQLRGKTYKIPMPFGMNALTAASGRITQLAVNMAKGRDDRVPTAVNDVAKTAAQAMVPWGVTEGYGALLPTPLQIGHNLAVNEDDFGGRIRDQDQYDKTEAPRASIGRASTPEPFHWLAKALNRIGGGDDYTRPLSFLDWAPEDLQYMTRYVTGGLGSTITRAVGAGQQAAAGVPVTVDEIPIVSSFLGEIRPERYVQDQYFKARPKIEKARERYRNTYTDEGPAEAKKERDADRYAEGLSPRRRQDGRVIKTATGRPQLREQGGTVQGAYRKSEKALKDIRARKRAIYNDQSLPMAERLRRIEALNQQAQQAQRETVRQVRQ